jgi:hypothetical protein
VAVAGRGIQESRVLTGVPQLRPLLLLQQDINLSNQAFQFYIRDAAARIPRSLRKAIHASSFPESPGR